MTCLPQVKSLLLFVVLLYLILYLPLTFIAYFPSWYRLNCRWHPRCEQIGEEKAFQVIGELTQFFRHQGELTLPWTFKERLHLAEVRDILDRLFLGLPIALILLPFLFNHSQAIRFSLINVMILLSSS
jgi:hypothetical protein